MYGEQISSRIDISSVKADAGRRLRRHRLRRGLSPEALGSLVGVSGRTIRRIEDGFGPRFPRARTMVLLGEELGPEFLEDWYRSEMASLPEVVA